MSEQVLETPTVAVEPAATFNPFDDSSWRQPAEAPQSLDTLLSEQPVVAPPVEEVAPPAGDLPITTPAEDVFDEKDYLQKTFGYESPETLLHELKALKEAKEKGIEFANDDSRRVYEYIKEQKEEELLQFLDKKKKVNTLLTVDLSDPNSASEIVKLSMLNNGSGLSQSEVDYLYNKKFGVPPAPVMKDLETEEEFAERKNAYDTLVNEKKMELIIEAKMAKPVIEKLKTELVLPDIQKPQPVQNDEPSQEELAKIQQARERFLQGVESTFTNFNGFNMVYKSEAGDIPISYSPTEEQKVSFKQDMSGNILGKMVEQRWFPSEDNPNIPLLTEDMFFLNNKEAILQKVASEAYAKGFANYLKSKSNINITPGGQQTFTPQQNGQSDLDKQIAAIWSA